MPSPKLILLTAAMTICLVNGVGLAQDWPQWRGAERDAGVSGFVAPSVWPKALTQRWKVTVGDGIATPALANGKLYVFARQDSYEVTRCLDANSGKTVWQDKYPALGVSGPGSGFSGPRCTPAVSDGKVVTLGVHGVLSCYDAAAGKLLWRKSYFQDEPKFGFSGSPLIVDGLCIAQLGGQSEAAIVACDLKTGSVKWKSLCACPGYSSPALMTVDDVRLVVAETDRSVLAVSLADGKQVWEAPFEPREREQNAASPVVSGNILIYTGAGRGTHAVKFEKSSGGIAASSLWDNGEVSGQFCSPVWKDGRVYGISQSNALYCQDAKTGSVLWTTQLAAANTRGGGADGGRGFNRPPGGFGPDRPRRSGGGGGGKSYGVIVSSDQAMFAMTPSAEMVVFSPAASQYTELTKFKLADTPTYAYPVISGKQIYVKDQDSLILWAMK